MPQLIDGSIDAVVRAMSDDPLAETNDWWDPYEGDDTWLKLWSGNDWWKSPSKPAKVPGAETTPVQFAKGFDPEQWMSKYDNGRIPMAAMVRVGREASGAAAFLRPDAAAAWKAAVAAAARDGVKLTITDSYRSYAQQVATYHDGGAPAATPGTSNHGWGIALDIGEGEQREWMAKHGGKFGFVVLSDPYEPWHFDFRGQGAPGFDPKALDIIAEMEKTKQDKPKEWKPELPDVTLVPASMGVQPNLAMVSYGIMQDIKRDSRPKDAPPKFTDVPGKGGSGSIKEQLYQGFMDAGKPALARMVRTKDFQTWINAESGWNPDIVSQFFPGHGRNAGLFQFALLDRQWVWTDVNRSNWTYRATPYEQARLVVQYFNLTPADIHRYADQIRAGTYHGWG